MVPSPDWANPDFTVLKHCLLIFFAFPAIVWGCEPWSVENRANQNLSVGNITLNINDVFNQQLDNENALIHRLANRLHIESRESLIQAQLLFAKGDVFDVNLLEETARNLRRNSYLRRATITPLRICDGAVDILVQTGDNWSLIPGMNFSRAGGENEFSLSVSELNLFGLGKSLGLELDYGRVRDQQVLQYFDPMLFGTTTQFGTQFQNNTDGQVQIIEFEKPFNSLDSRRSWRVRAGNTEYEQNLYDNGFRVNQLAVDNEFFSFKAGASKGKQLIRRNADGTAIYRVTRYSLGWQYSRYQLGATDLFPESTPVDERIFSYPFFEISLLQPAFIKQSNLQLMESVEDINIGHSIRTRIGLASEAFGSNTNALQAELDFNKGWQLNNKTLGLLKASLDGFYTADGIQNGVASTTLETFYFFSAKSRFYTSANIVSATRLFENRQLVLGGATGLRGYPLNFQTGSRRTRFTLEHRYFFDWYPLRLARIGTAAFFDTGAAWDKSEEQRWLSDVGIGLRIVGTRQANAKVMHIDFAFPLNETDRIDRFQLVVSAKTQF